MYVSPGARVGTLPSSLQARLVVIFLISHQQHYSGLVSRGWHWIGLLKSTIRFVKESKGVASRLKESTCDNKVEDGN